MRTKISLTLCLLLLGCMAIAQPCKSYSCVIKKAKTALQQKDYTTAFNQLEAATAYKGKHSKEIASLRQQLFDSMISEVRAGQKNKQQLETALKIAKKESLMAIKAREMANESAKQAKIAEKKALMSRKAAEQASLEAKKAEVQAHKAQMVAVLEKEKAEKARIEALKLSRKGRKILKKEKQK